MVFLLQSIVLWACTPKLAAVERMPPLEVEEEATDTAAHPSLLPDIEQLHAGVGPLRLDEAYPLLQRALRSTQTKRVKQACDELDRADTLFPDRLALLEGQAQERLEDFDAARAAYSKAL